MHCGLETLIFVTCIQKFAGRKCGLNNSLEVVDAVARNGSFSAAAQELHRVPSAISYTVRQLEECWPFPCLSAAIVMWS
ncbi:LysR-family transcriptional regulator YdhB [Klebsiella variicola]|uniref:LysR-family transcriptional regulator YdhB n=1 Tax=Klebsiella variicola TaxID=244366 RepID=A0A7H4MLG0_KLEVA|nr:LysR-family transcriptional regulator YdhB [Klebsiella variicola]